MSRILPYLALASFLVAGCGGTDDASSGAPNTGPVLDTVDAPAEVTAGAAGSGVPVTFRFHDPEGDAIARFRYRIPDASVDRTQEAPAGSVGLALTIVAGASTPKKPYEILFSAFDAKGIEGPVVSKTVTFR